MGWTIPQIKKAIKDGAAAYGITEKDAERVFLDMVKNDPDGLTTICAGGSWDSFMPAADRCGVKIKRAAGDRSKKSTVKEKAPELVRGDVVPAVWADGVPGEVVQRVNTALGDYCAQFAVDDMSKDRQTRWSAACMYIGWNVFKPSKLLHDVEKEKQQGGNVYDVPRVAALVDLFLYLCASLVKAPFINDFCNFSGVSNAWIFGKDGRLTPERMCLLQKLRDAQENGLAGLISDGRQNPTGALAILNHWHGWTQTREIIHTDGGRASDAAALPTFGGSDLVGIAEKPENTRFLE